ASFKERAQKIGVTPEVLQELAEAGYTTFGRRLLFEANSLNIADLHARVEPPAENIVRRLPAAERAARAQAQQARLAGVVFTPDTTPANSLVDLFVDQLESDILQYIGPERCVSRSQEMMSVKKDKTLNVDPEGRIRVTAKPNELRCETSSDAKLRAAWGRRSLAMDLAGICSYIEIEKWVQHLFSIQAREVPKGMAPISVNQLIQADRALFLHASEKLMGQLSAPAGAPKPLDGVIKDLMHSQEVLQFVQPVPRVPDPPQPWQPWKPTGKGRKGKDDPKKGKGLHVCWKDQSTATIGGTVPSPPAEALPNSQGRRQGDEFSKSFVSGHTYTSFALFSQLEASVHVDSHNLPGSLNAVFALSDFQDGNIIVEDVQGPEHATYRGRILSGRVVPFVNHVLQFDAQSQRHWTQPWKGTRQVLVAYSVSLKGLTQPDLDFLRGLNFQLPAPIGDPHVLPDARPWAFEIFAGSASLSKASAVSILWDLIRRVQPALKAAGAPEPRPLRDALHPLGPALAWSAAAGVYDSMQLYCDNKHEHAPWSVQRINGRWHFATSSEAAYPALMAARMARCLLDFLRPSLGSLSARPANVSAATATAGRQSKKHAPLVPEFARVSTMPSPQVQKGMKILREVSFQGEKSGDVQDFSGKVEPSPADLVKVGIYHTPSEHVAEAMELEHPFDVNHAVSPITVEAIDFLMSSSPEQVVLHRKLALLKLQLLIKRTEKEEAALHDSMPPSVAKVMRGKKLVALRILLEQEGYDDMESLRFLSEGVKVMGSEPHPPCFDKKVKPATLTEMDLRETAEARRRAITGSSTRDDSCKASILQEVTQEEVNLGFLDGPYSAEEISNLVGHENWCVIRRFLIEQGAKHRPIDDACQSQTNAAYSATIKLELHNADYIACIALLIAKKIKGGEQRFGSGEWTGKCLDLTKAYKQIALHPSHRDLCVTYFKGADGKDRFYLPNSLMFGASAAVFGFIRVSRCLHFLVNRFLKVPSAVYFDDFPLFTPVEGAEAMDEAVSQFLSLLGWDHARTGAKGKPCAPAFDVLGMTLDLSKVQQGLVTLKNKPGRAEKILDEFAKVNSPEAITRHQVQVLHGLLNFAAGFFSGRSLKHLCYDLLEFLEWRGEVAFDRLQGLAERTRAILNNTPPRVLSCLFVPEPILVWTDGSWEDGVAGIGACIWDPLVKVGRVLSGFVPSWALETWRADFEHNDKEPQLICHIELFVIVAVRWIFRDQFLNRRLVLFVDNEASRFAILKGGSGSRGMNTLIRAFDSLDVMHPCFYWLDRVPSFSNVADGPSRQESDLAVGLLKAPSVEDFTWPQGLEEMIVAERKRKGEIRA
ncbi:unnamed protein product, partial [Symbiodinium necroappetens]